MAGKWPAVELQPVPAKLDLHALCMPTCLVFGRALRTHEGSAAALVEVLEEVVGGQLDLLVAPLGGPVLAGDQAHAVEAAEVAVDEGVPSLGLVAGAIGETMSWRARATACWLTV